MQAERTISPVAVGAAILWAAFIFWMSAHTSGQMGEGLLAQVRQVLAGLLGSLGFPGYAVSVLGHFTEYLVFGVLLANAARRKFGLRKAALVAIVIASLYGVTDEIHQLFVPGRKCDPFDWLVDTIAATIGSCAFCGIVHARATRIAKGV